MRAWFKSFRFRSSLGRHLAQQGRPYGLGHGVREALDSQVSQSLVLEAFLGFSHKTKHSSSKSFFLVLNKQIPP